MCLRPFGLYCSACLGILFVSIFCMCCSHFSWYCFISFTIFSASVFSLIHWYFVYLVLLFQEGVLKILSLLLLNIVPLFSSVPRLHFRMSLKHQLSEDLSWPTLPSTKQILTLSNIICGHELNDRLDVIRWEDLGKIKRGVWISLGTDR